MRVSFWIMHKFDTLFIQNLFFCEILISVGAGSGVPLSGHIARRIGFLHRFNLNE